MPGSTNDATGQVILLAGGAANRPTLFTDFSPDGTKALFTDLNYDANGFQTYSGNYSIYVRDLKTGTVTPITNKLGSLVNENVLPKFSPDGASIVFTSASTTLVPGDTNNAYDVFLMSIATGAVTRLSTTGTGAQANGYSTYGSLSPDGRRLLFSSDASNLVAGDTNASTDVFMKDLVTGGVTRVSTTSAGGQFSTSSGNATVSWAANTLFFVSHDQALQPGHFQFALYAKNLATGVVTRLSDSVDGTQIGSVASYSISADGTKAAFWSSDALVAGDTNGILDLFVKDLTTGALTRVSTRTDGGQTTSVANDGDEPPAFSPDGTKLVFVGTATDLVPGDTNGGPDVFVKDLVTGAVTRVSTAADGSQGLNARALRSIEQGPLFSPDGGSIGFSLDETGLVPGALPAGLNAFVKVLHSAPGTAADFYVASYAAPLVVSAASGVLANDVIPDGNGTLSATTFTGAQHGRVNLLTDGSFTYTPDGTFVGVDSFTYRATSGFVTSGDTAVTIRVDGNIQRADTGPSGAQSTFGSFFDQAAFSPDGKSIAFMTTSPELVPGGTNGGSAIVIKTLGSGAIRVVGPRPASGYQSSAGDATFSPDGTKLAFTSGDYGAIAGNDIVVANLATGALTVVSTTQGGAEGNVSSYGARFSPDGTKIVFTSLSANLVSGNTHSFVSDIYVKNLVTGAITWVSTDNQGKQANGASSSASFSPDGNSVVFTSSATNLVPDDTNARDDIFIKNLVTGAVTLVSTAADGTQELSGNAQTPVFSPDGKSVAFASDASNLVPGDTNQAIDVFVKNLTTGAISRVSTTATGAQQDNTGSTQSAYPVFSPDGTRIAFSSQAGNLAAGAVGGAGTVFEKNLVTGAVRLVSSDSFGAANGSFATKPAYSPDGTLIAFDSYANNLVPGDTNNAADLFVKDLTKFPYNPANPPDTAPVLIGLTPANGATQILAGANIVLTFDKAVLAGTGAITIADNSGDVRVIPVGDASQVAVAGTTVTINPAADLRNGDTYHVTLGSRGFVDAAGTAFAGLPSGALDFTTAPPVVVPPADPLFDAAYYLAHNPDVAAAGVDPYQHYIAFGWRDGRNPSALFNTTYYLNQNPDVRAAGVNPLVNFEAFGWREGRDPSISFSLSRYLAANPDVRAAGVDPAVQYMQYGKAEGRLAFAATPHSTGPVDPLVTAAYVYANNPDVAAAGLDASAWYNSAGWLRGANPSAYFDTNYYLTQNPDVRAAGVDPLAHFEAIGWKEGRQPSLVFDDAKYLAANADVRAAQLDPLVHYLGYGVSESRPTFLAGGTAPADPLVNAAYFDAQLGATLVPPGTAGAQQAANAYDHGGWQANLKPDALFDTAYYLAHNADVAAAHLDPLLHYEAYGWHEGRDPSAAFSTNKYLAAYSDVRAAGVDPLLHYVLFGQMDGRAIFPV